MYRVNNITGHICLLQKPTIIIIIIIRAIHKLKSCRVIFQQLIQVSIKLIQCSIQSLYMYHILCIFGFWLVLYNFAYKRNKIENSQFGFKIKEETKPNFLTIKYITFHNGNIPVIFVLYFKFKYNINGNFFCQRNLNEIIGIIIM